MHTKPLAFLSSLALAAPAVPAQTFTSGDVYIHGITQSPVGGVLARVDRATGTTTQVLSIRGAPSIGLGTMTWDPARQGIALMLSLDSSIAPSLQLWRADGSLEDLTGPIGQHYSLSAGKNGRLYCWQGLEIHYVEPDGSLHTLLDASSGLPFVHDPGIGIGNDLIAYHAPTHSLYSALLRGSTHPCNGGTPGIIVSRLPLSADGTAVAGPVDCTVLTMPPEGLGGYPIAWVPLPSGKPGLVTSGSFSTASSAARIFEVDPATLAFQTFASPGGYQGPSFTTAGAWSWAEKKVIVLDPVADVLRSYKKAGTGVGTIRPLALDMSSQLCAMVEVPPKTLVLPQGLLGHLLSLVPWAQPAVLSGAVDHEGGAPTVRLEGVAPHASVHLRAVAGARGMTRSAILDPGLELTLPAGDGELWERALAPALAGLAGWQELRVQALVVDGVNVLVTNELVLERE